MPPKTRPRAKRSRRSEPSLADTRDHGKVRRASDVVLATIPARFAAMDERVSRVERGLTDNTELTQRVFDNTSAIVATVEWLDKTRRGFVWVSKYIIIPIGGAVAAIYSMGEHAAKFDLVTWVRKFWGGM